MKEQDKKEIRQVFNEGFTQLVLPQFDAINKRFDKVEKRLDKVEDKLGNVEKSIDYLQQDVTTIDRKLDAEISWRDDASKRIKQLEINTGLVK